MSDSENEENQQYQLQKYSLVRFIHKGRKRLIESVDIVPSKWLDFDKAKARCVTKFMAAPYNDEDLQLIHNLVINNIDAPEDWPTFSIEQVGRAKTYKEGLQKIKKLEKEENVLTLESEDSASEAQRQLTLAIKRQKRKAEAMKLNSSFSQGIKDVTNTQAAVKRQGNLRDEKIGEVHKDLTRVYNDTSSCGSKSLLYESKTTITCDKPSCSTSTSETKELNSTKNEVIENFNVDSATDIVATESMAGIKHDGVIHENSSTIVAEITLEDLPIVQENITNNEQIYFNNVECKTSFQLAVIMRLDQIMKDIAELKLDVASLKTTQAQTTSYLSDKKILTKDTVDFEQKYQVKIPLQTYQEFEAFDEKLNKDTFFQKDIYTELKPLMDKDLVITKSIVQMLKRFFDKDLAKQFTAVRNSVNKTKYKLRPTTFCNMMEAIITKRRKEKNLDINQELFTASLTDVLSNVAKWK